MKQEIICAPILVYYSLKKQTVLQTDASIKGLGARLLQEDKLVYFASKALTETQQGYVAIELESLAVAWTMKKFHHFLNASHFILETDQKPLETMLSKSIHQATPRLQRILIRTFPYHFTVQYIPGLTKQLADCLSCLGGQKDIIKLPKLYAFQITSQLCARSVAEVPSAIQSYLTFREELTMEDGIILKGTRIVMPAMKRETVLKLIHEGHLGLNKCKLHAKETVYWPGLNDQIEKHVLNCELCLKYLQGDSITPLDQASHRFVSF